MATPRLEDGTSITGYINERGEVDVPGLEMRHLTLPGRQYLQYLSGGVCNTENCL